jgi:CRISPR-associated protein Csh2
MSFKNRVFGCVIVKSINSNYNADFSNQPRTLPDGTVYATDKALKYTIRNYWDKMYPNEKVFYFTRYDENGNPKTLDGLFLHHFGAFPTKIIIKGTGKKAKEHEITDKPKLKENLLECLDIRCFGATYAGHSNVSIHGAVQINHGINIWKENNIFSEQIKSPVATEEGDNMTTIGRSAKLQEGHYIHHFSVNPVNSDFKLTNGDIDKLKDAMSKGVTYYDSTSKAGTDNEILFWVQLKENSKKVLPNFNSLITKEEVSKTSGKITFDFSRVAKLLEKYAADLDKVEIYYQSENTNVTNIPSMAKTFDLN